MYMYSCKYLCPSSDSCIHICLPVWIFESMLRCFFLYLSVGSDVCIYATIHENPGLLIEILYVLHGIVWDFTISWNLVTSFEASLVGLVLFGVVVGLRLFSFFGGGGGGGGGSFWLQISVPYNWCSFSGEQRSECWLWCEWVRSGDNKCVLVHSDSCIHYVSMYWWVVWCVLDNRVCSKY